ncbi:MAG TPA: alkaline phosphatase family protein, partial [Acidimicrobiales bacterium]|nr:alkaline phosphatase family protein [Acidimicrobiales bacterium]
LVHRPFTGPPKRDCYDPPVARRGCDYDDNYDDEALTDAGGEAGAPRLTRRQLLGAGLAGGAGLALSACSGSGVVRRAASVRPSGRDLDAIQHVVYVMQENRSFDHYFGSYRGVRGFNDHQGSNLGPFAQAWPADPSTPHPRTLLPYHLDAATVQAQCAGSSDKPIHDWPPQHQSWNGGHPNFVAVHAQQSNDGPAQGPLVMGYLDRTDLPFYYALADTFTICDNYYCSVLGPTMPNRLYFMSGTMDPTSSHGGPVMHTPGFSDSLQAVGSVDWPTMPEQLSAHNISWKVYQPPGSAVPVTSLSLAAGFNALLYFKQYLQPGSDLYKRAFLPTWPDEFAADVRQGTLPQVSWLLPTIVDSEHPSAVPDLGMAYVNQVLHTLASNPDVWSKTVLFVTYDENGGFFDHVAPPTAPPGTAGEYLTGTLPAKAGGISGPIGLGFRVPTLVLSPFSRGGYVNSDTFDHTSMLRFLETRFGVPVPNLSPWRRSTVGDLTSTLAFGSTNASVPPLPAAPGSAPPTCPNSTNEGSLLSAAPQLSIPTNQHMPSQEAGTARRRS